MKTAPTHWAYYLFPLMREGEERLPLDDVVGIAHNLIDCVLQTGDRAYLGPVLHWAHHLKIEQGPEGDWPAVVNARTGDSAGPARTRTPAGLLARLGGVLNSTEFDDAVALAGPAQPEPSHPKTSQGASQ